MENKKKMQAQATALIAKLAALDYGLPVKNRPGKHEFYTHSDVESYNRFAAAVTAGDPILLAKKYHAFIELMQRKSIKDLGTVIYGDDFAEKRETWDHNVAHNTKLVIPR